MYYVQVLDEKDPAFLKPYFLFDKTKLEANQLMEPH